MANFVFVAQAIQFIDVEAENEAEAQKFMDNQSTDTIHALVGRFGGWMLLDTPELREEYV